MRSLGVALLSLLVSGTPAQIARPRTAAHLVLPNYFSGTNCRVGASSGIFGTHIGVNRFTLTLSGGGTSQSWTTTQDWGGEPPDSGALAITKIFDSTHFAPGTSLTVTWEAWDVYGGHYGPASASALTVNKAAVYGRNEWESDPYSPTAGTPAAVNAFGAVNHDFGIYVITSTWSRSQVLADLQNVTAFYVNTHGNLDQNGGWFLSGCVADPDHSPRSEMAYGSDVLPFRQAGVGNGNPPFNSGGPPIWLAYIDCCHASDDNGLADGLLWPYTNAYDNSLCEDQAQVGWRIFTDADQTNDCSTTFWSKIAQGYTANYARQQVFETYKGSNKGQSPYDTLAVWGDFATTLHGVYRGVDDGMPSTGWYR